MQDAFRWQLFILTARASLHLSMSKKDVTNIEQSEARGKYDIPVWSHRSGITFKLWGFPPTFQIIVKFLIIARSFISLSHKNARNTRLSKVIVVPVP